MTSPPVPPVRGPAAIALLNLRCLVVLLGSNVTVGLVVAAASGAGDLPGVVLLLASRSLVACVPVGVVGIPAGLLTAHLLDERRARGARVVFALVGSVLAALTPGCARRTWLAAIRPGRGSDRCRRRAMVEPAGARELVPRSGCPPSNARTRWSTRNRRGAR